MHKESFIINCNTHIHVSTLLGHLQGEHFCYRYPKVALYISVRVCCWLCTVYWKPELSVVPVCTVVQCKPGSQRVHASSTQSTAHSHSTIKCNLRVTITKSSPWRWPSRVETCRSVLQSMIKLSLCICWWLVFLFNYLICNFKRVPDNDPTGSKHVGLRRKNIISVVM
jgi:hypothetical protein